MSYLPEPFIPEGINPNNNYTFTCINRVNNNYKAADIISSNYNDTHYLKSYTNDIAVSDASFTKFNNAVSLSDSLKTTNNILSYNYGKSYINNDVLGDPINGSFGSSSTRIILLNGNSTNPPIGIGVGSFNTLWFSTLNTGSFSFFNGTISKLTIGINNILLGTNVNIKMQEGIIDLSNTTGTINSPIYLSLSGSSVLGVANTNFQYSTSSTIGDTILKAQPTKRLLLQSGAGDAAISIIDNGSGSSLSTSLPIYANSFIKPNTVSLTSVLSRKSERLLTVL